MKKTLLLFGLATFYSLFGAAQSKPSGIYLNESDFENNRLSYASNDASEKYKIRFNEFLDKPFITVKHNGEKTIIYKEDVFAYQNKGKIVRTHDLVSYTFVEKGVIWIYYKDVDVLPGKGIKREKKYYYSVSGKDEIVPLTTNNLKMSFAGKHLFHHLLEARFRKDADLSLYDSIEKKHTVNHLLETTVFATR